MPLPHPGASYPSARPAEAACRCAIACAKTSSPASSHLLPPPPRPHRRLFGLCGLRQYDEGYSAAAVANYRSFLGLPPLPYEPKGMPATEASDASVTWVTLTPHTRGSHQWLRRRTCAAQRLLGTSAPVTSGRAKWPTPPCTPTSPAHRACPYGACLASITRVPVCVCVFACAVCATGDPHAGARGGDAAGAIIKRTRTRTLPTRTHTHTRMHIQPLAPVSTMQCNSPKGGCKVFGRRTEGPIITCDPQRAVTCSPSLTP
jgi:hypothetical protein